MLISKWLPIKVLLFYGLVLLVAPTKLCALGVAEASRKSSEFTINIAETVQGEWHHDASIRFFSALYQPLGIAPVFVSYPTKRALKWVSEGIVDAEAARVDGLDMLYPGLLKVPAAVMIMSTAIFCQVKEKCTLSTSSLIAVKQGFIFGKKVCDDNNLQCIEASESKLVAKLLDKPMADALLTSLHESYQIICRLLLSSYS